MSGVAHPTDASGRILAGAAPGWGVSWWLHEQGVDPDGWNRERRAIATDDGCSCAALRDGVECWGRTTAASSGDGTRTESPAPVMVSKLTNATAIAAGSSHACAALPSGAVDCWGDNSGGQLGNGTTTSSSTPVGFGGVSVSIPFVEAGG
jgi:Regulator of chromosome condensation (RCC1) repeat